MERQQNVWGLFWNLFLMVALIGLGSGLVLGQTTTAIISGTVTDETGGVLPGAEVSVLNVGTGAVRDTVSDDAGRYRVPELAPGNYEVSGSLVGFRTIVRSGITLTVGRHAQVELSLRVGEISERVTVTGEASLVETTTSVMSGLVDEQQIRDLPLNGRNFVQLTLLEPGVHQARTAGSSSVTGGGLKMSIHGARMDYNSFIMDGTSIQSVNQQAIGGSSGEAMGVETIREFQVLTSNFSAEFGGAGGGVINVVTKSGTNELHGSVFYFHRNDNLDATGFFSNKRNQEKPEFRRNQFGFTLGGPIVADKTFIFGGYEGLRESLGRSLAANVPTALARQGILPGGTVPVDPAIPPYLDLFPAGNGEDNGDGTEDFNSSGDQITHQDFYQVRVDHTFSDSNSFFGRYTIDDSSKIVPQSIPTWIQSDTVRAQYVTLEDKHIFSPTLLNVARVGFNRTRVAFTQDPLDDRVCCSDPSLWFIQNPNVEGLGRMQISGVSDPGGAFNRPKIRLNNTFQYSDTINYNRGTHSLKIGADVQRIQTNEFDTFRGMGHFGFDSLTDFLTNQPGSYRGVTAESDYNRGYRQTQFGLFVQDDVDVSPNLTLNLGLRWEFITSPTEVNDKTAHQILPPFDTTTIVGGPLMILPKNNFAPRVGLAWDPFGDGKTSIRIGAGMFHQMIYRHFYFSSRLLPPIVITMQPPSSILTFPDPLAGGFDPATGRQSIEPASYDNNQLPYMVQYNLSIQRELLPSTVLMVGYVGSRGQHLGRFHDPNNAIPAQICPCTDDPSTPEFDQSTLAPGTKYFTGGSRRRNSTWGRLRFKSLSAASWYNALQVKLTRRMGQGLQFQASYTWSHSNDNGSGTLGGDFDNNNVLPQDPYRLHDSEWGRSAFDLTQVLVANFNYDFPQTGLTGAGGVLLNGWQVSGIVNITDGAPFTAENSGDRDRDAARSGSRPNLIGTSNNPVLGGPDQYFDVNAFELQPRGTYGNLGKNTIIGPGLATFDFALKKHTTLGERANLEFRFELFNLFNRANFDTPSGTIFTGSGRGVTGRPRSSGAQINDTITTNRQIQFGLKLAF